MAFSYVITHLSRNGGDDGVAVVKSIASEVAAVVTSALTAAAAMEYFFVAVSAAVKVAV